MKHVLLTLCIILSFLTVNAQELESNKTKFGLKFGVSYNYTQEDQKTNRDNFFGGLFIERKLSNKLDLQVELLYEIVYDIYQLELPINLKYNFNDKFGVYFGGELNYMLKDRDITARVAKSFGAGANLGFQYNILENWVLDLRYTYGFQEQYRFTNALTGSKETIRFSIGYKF